MSKQKVLETEKGESNVNAPVQQKEFTKCYHTEVRMPGDMKPKLAELRQGSNTDSVQRTRPQPTPTTEAGINQLAINYKLRTDT